MDIRRHILKQGLTASLTMALLIVGLSAPTEATKTATPHKVVVCKYVSKPNHTERLQTGQNPIVVDKHSIPGFTGTFPYKFADAQGNSIAIRWAANSHDGSITECPGYTPPPSPPPGPKPTPTPTPPPETGGGSVEATGYVCGDPRIIVTVYNGTDARAYVSLRWKSGKTHLIRHTTIGVAPRSQKTVKRWAARGVAWVGYEGHRIWFTKVNRQTNIGPCR